MDKGHSRERRGGKDRRQNVTGYHGKDRRQNVVDRRLGLDLRRGPGRRLTVARKSAEEGQMSDEQFEFLMAIQEYKSKNAKPFPTWTEVLEVIKKDAGLKRIPVIVLTSSNRGLDVTRAYDLGCNSYIVKPVNYDNFLKAVIEIQKYWILLCEIPND